jgi:outer membrane protein assembly factor BamB
MCFKSICAVVAGLLLAISIDSLAEDWPQYRGQRRDGKTTERIATTWPTTHPAEVWRADVGKGHSPVSVSGPKAVTLGYTGKSETVWCLNAATGKRQWRFDYPAASRLKDEPGNGAYDGPHAAPAIHKGKVYTLSRDGQVHCLSIETGKPLWSRNLLADQKDKLPECGFAGSPMLLDGMVIVSVGAAGTALDADTGQTKWQSGQEIAGYGAPTLVAEAGGQRRLLFFAYKELAAVNPADGKRQWSLPWATRWGANVADPVAIGDSVFISSA